MPNTAWDMVTQYIVNDRHDQKNPTKKYRLKSRNLTSLLEVT